MYSFLFKLLIILWVMWFLPSKRLLCVISPWLWCLGRFMEELHSGLGRSIWGRQKWLQEARCFWDHELSRKKKSKSQSPGVRPVGDCYSLRVWLFGKSSDLLSLNFFILKVGTKIGPISSSFSVWWVSDIMVRKCLEPPQTHNSVHGEY